MKKLNIYGIPIILLIFGIIIIITSIDTISIMCGCILIAIGTLSIGAIHEKKNEKK